jgi:hypothetical protein
MMKGYDMKDKDRAKRLVRIDEEYVGVTNSLSKWCMVIALVLFFKLGSLLALGVLVVHVTRLLITSVEYERRVVLEYDFNKKTSQSKAVREIEGVLFFMVPLLTLILLISVII